LVKWLVTAWLAGSEAGRDLGGCGFGPSPRWHGRPSRGRCVTATSDKDRTGRWFSKGVAQTGLTQHPAPLRPVQSGDRAAASRNAARQAAETPQAAMGRSPLLHPRRVHPGVRGRLRDPQHGQGAVLQNAQHRFLPRMVLGWSTGHCGSHGLCKGNFKTFPAGTA